MHAPGATLASPTKFENDQPHKIQTSSKSKRINRTKTTLILNLLPKTIKSSQGNRKKPKMEREQGRKKNNKSKFLVKKESKQQKND